MAVEIGALRALLSLDSAAFESGAKRAQASMNNLQRGLTRASERMRRVGRTLSTRVTAPLAAMGAVALRSSLQTIDAQSKMAQSLDTSTRSMQVLARAADRAGLSTGELEQIGRQLTRRLSQAAAGAGPAAEALEDLGLSAEELTGLDLDERIAQINAAIEDNVPASQRAAVAAKIFGDRAGLLATRLDAGVIRQASDEVERFGLAVTELEADQIEEANDAISALGLVSRGLANQLAVALAPTLKTIAERIADVGAWFANLSPDMQRLVGISASLAAAVGPLAIALGFMAAGLAAIASPIGLVVFGLGAVAGAAALVAANWDELKGRFSILEKAASFGAALRERWANLPALKWAALIPVLRWAPFVPKIAWRGLAGALRWTALIASFRWAKFIPKIAWSGLAGALSWSSLIPVLRWTARFIPVIGWVSLAGTLAWELIIKPLNWDRFIPQIDWRKYLNEDRLGRLSLDLFPERLTTEMNSRGAAQGRGYSDGMAEGVSQGAGAVEDAARAAARAAEGAAREESETRSPSRVFMRIGQDLMAGLSSGIGQGAGQAAEAARDAARQVGDAVGETDSTLQTLRDSAKTIFRDVLTGARSLSDSVASVLQGIGNRLLDAGLGQLTDAIFPTPRALGGPVMANRPYLVGERGPELMVPQSAGTIVPNDALGRGGGGTFAPSIAIDARGADQAVVARLETVVGEMLSNFEGMVQDTLRDGARRRHNIAWQT